jgi:hypothetical protein
MGMVKRLSRIVLAGWVLAAALMACSSGGDDDQASPDDQQETSSPLDGDGRDAYVVAFEETGRDPVSGDLTEGATCTAEAVVDGVGVDRLRDVATPREIAAAANGAAASLSGLGAGGGSGMVGT